MAPTTTLIQAGEDDFDWLLGNAAPTLPYRVAPDLAPREVLEIIRPLPANWFVMSGDEIVGLVSLKSEDGDTAEIGYGVAASRQGQSHASAGVAALLPILAKRGLSAVTAETSVDNVGSQRVLERNGFQRIGERMDDEDGSLIIWHRAV